MSNQRISELTTSSTPIKATDYLEVSVYNGTTYDSKKVNSDYLKPYKVYTALISQSGFSNPTVTVLENTIGSIVWTRGAIGQYDGTLTGAFTSAKTFGLITLSNTSNSAMTFFSRTSANVIRITTRDHVYSGVDSLLSDASIEIRVYQ